jgi:glycosyltransferase involved in cell wall biosynthesis
MSEQVKISVVMSVYNGQEFLRSAMDSILRQTYKDFEFLIINDGSNDNTEQIIKSYDDSRIVYIKNKRNLGLIDSLNTGLTKARGELIARMDADDIAIGNRIELQYDFFMNNPDMVVCGTDYYAMTERALKRVRNINDSDYLKAILLFSTCFCHPTVMYKNVFKSSNVEYEGDFLHAEDYRLWTNLSRYGNFGILDIPLLKYRSHSAQISHKHHERQLGLSGRIRIDYLNQMGFICSDENMIIHNLIANNTFIRSLTTLHQIESWLTDLLSQNSTLGAFNNCSFEKVIYKFWTDSCGNSNLGRSSYKVWKNSSLRNLRKVTTRSILKMAAKLLVRSFRK